MQLKIKHFLVIFVFSVVFKFNAMCNDTIPYHVLPTHDCIKYLESSGLSIYNNSKYTIKSHSGLVYELPNNEFILMPSNFDQDYPSIIFKNKETFMHYAALDYFPIGDENMTWFEKYKDQIKQFRTNPKFYIEELNNVLNLKMPFKNVSDIEVAFTKIQSIFANNEYGSKVTEKLMYSFGLEVCNYLIDFSNFKLVLKEGYENYNPNVYPLLEKNNMIIDVLSKCVRHLSNYSPNSFKLFKNGLNLK